MGGEKEASRSSGVRRRPLSQTRRNKAKINTLKNSPRFTSIREQGSPMDRRETLYI